MCTNSKRTQLCIDSTMDSIHLSECSPNPPGKKHQDTKILITKDPDNKAFRQVRLVYYF